MLDSTRTTWTRTARVGPLLLVTALVLALGACRSRRVATPGTGLADGDVMMGRLADGQGQQTFTFEGVESSLLDFTVVADRGDLAAPQIRMLDPEGNAVDLLSHLRTPQGAATTHVRDLVLLRSGIYQVTAVPTIPGQEVFYRFSYDVRFPPIEDMRATLQSDNVRPVYVSAPRGAMITVTLRPLPDSDVRPQIRGVEDPWGGRALDPSRRVEGVPAPTLTTGDDRSVWLNFVATVPGRYKILTSAYPGTAGPVAIDAKVRVRSVPNRAVLHPNRPSDAFGVPVPRASGSMSDPD